DQPNPRRLRERRRRRCARAAPHAPGGRHGYVPTAMQSTSGRTRPNVRLGRRDHRHLAHAGARRLRYNYLLDPVDSGDLVLRQARDPSAAADSGLPGAVADACRMRGCMQRVESGVSAAAARLLIVDDEAAHMRALCDTLEREGCVTRGFTSGREALEALREQSFDLLLTDLQMPDIDGIKLLRACLANDR